MIPPLACRLLQSLAPEFGARAVLDAGGHAGYLEFADGRRSFFRNGNVGVNPASAADIARDKAYAARFLGEFGWPVPRHVLLLDERLRRAVRRHDPAAEPPGFGDAADIAERLGWPVVVKPNDASHGLGIAVAGDAAAVRAAVAEAATLSRKILVERWHAGRDWRIVVFDGAVVAAYERRPLAVTGDGASTVAALLAARRAALAAEGRVLEVENDDPRLAGRSLDAVPEAGRAVRLLAAANLSAGGTAVDVTERLHADWRDMAIAVAADLGLALCGIDVLADDITAAMAGDWVIPEVNDAPGLDHFAALGPAQMGIAVDLYRRVIGALYRSPFLRHASAMTC